MAGGPSSSPCVSPQRAAQGMAAGSSQGKPSQREKPRTQAAMSLQTDFKSFIPWINELELYKFNMGKFQNKQLYK